MQLPWFSLRARTTPAQGISPGLCLTTPEPLRQRDSERGSLFLDAAPRPRAQRIAAAIAAHTPHGLRGHSQSCTGEREPALSRLHASIASIRRIHSDSGPALADALHQGRQKHDRTATLHSPPHLPLIGQEKIS